MSKINYGEIIRTESGMPRLEICIDENVKNLLVPFRLYSFQVTNRNGEWDLGASTVVGLCNLMGMEINRPEDTKGFSGFASNISKTENYVKTFMKGLALEAMFKFVARNANAAEINICLFSTANQSKMEEFIDACYDYVKEVTDRRS